MEAHTNRRRPVAWMCAALVSVLAFGLVWQHERTRTEDYSAVHGGVRPWDSAVVAADDRSVSVSYRIRPCSALDRFVVDPERDRVVITRRDKVAPGFEGVPECAGEAAVVVEQLRLSDPLSGRPLVDGSDGKESADVTFEPLPFADVAGGMKGTVQAALAEVPASDAPFAFSVRQACGPADEALPTVTVTLKDVTVAGGVRFVEEAAAAWRSVGLRVSEDGAGYVAVHPQRAWEMRVDAQGNDLVIAGVGTADEPTGPLPAGFEEDSGRCG